MEEKGSTLARDIRIHFLVLLSGGLVIAAASFFLTNSARSRAVINSVNISLTAQGKRREGDVLKARVAFYNGPAVAYEDKSVAFVQKNGIYAMDVGFGVGFNYGQRYAVFIKPEKHIGKLFCTEVATGSACTVPQFIFLSAGSSIDLRKSIFLAGDIAPENGKVDAQDMSLIMKNLGKMGPSYSSTDLNTDGITDVVDYSMALYSLSQNAHDDAVALQTPPSASASATPSPTFSLYPTSTATPSPAISGSPAPSPSATPLPTEVPTSTPTPTAVPTNTPTPTPSVKVPDYSKIAAMAHDYGEVGCPGGSATGCATDTLYNTPMNKGLGWATHYGTEHGYPTTTVIKNRKSISLEAAEKFVNDNFMEKQSDMTPEEAKKTGKVIAFAATRGPKDLWKIKYMFGIDDPKNPKPRFIGRVMIIDCAAPKDWYDPVTPPTDPNDLATYMWGYKGWSPSLNWIIDLSTNGFTQIPTGLSGQQGNTGEGRPGVVLIDESILDSMIY